MRDYELMFILDAGLEDEAVEGHIEKLKKVITDGGGEEVKVSKMGRRELAYEIKGKKMGNYVVMNFAGDSAMLAELRRVLKLTEEVLRYLVVAA